MRNATVKTIIEFLSTPSGWRATVRDWATLSTLLYFYPRPPGGGRHRRRQQRAARIYISIHALRVEGDRWRSRRDGGRYISIHALRVEGDPVRSKNALQPFVISIHALRVEGDCSCPQQCSAGRALFLSTPSGWRATPRGCPPEKCDKFLSTPSGWRATKLEDCRKHLVDHFYPRPPGGGRLFEKY